MQAYQTAVNKLRAWHGAGEEYTPLPFKEVTPAFCRGFQEHLASDLGNSANTQHKNLSTLKGFYKQAMEDDVIAWGRNPFEVLTLRKEAGQKEKLTTDELRDLKAAELETELERDVRRWFFFAFYAGGMRFSDVAELERRHIRQEEGETRVYYRMGKTRDLHGALLVPEAVEILEHYGWRQKGQGERVLPILDGYDTSTPQKRRQSIASRNTLANKYLKKIATRAGIEKSVSFHLSRHSTAGYLLEQGHDVRTIQRVLGHANVRVTEDYLRGFESSGPDDASRSLSL
jgi:site-specific recombinase XerD